MRRDPSSQYAGGQAHHHDAARPVSCNATLGGAARLHRLPQRFERGIAQVHVRDYADPMSGVWKHGRPLLLRRRAVAEQEHERVPLWRQTAKEPLERLHIDGRAEP
jgi:hypothetical protein